MATSHAEYMRNYRKTHPEKRYPERHRVRTQQLQQEQKMKVLTYYSDGEPKCAHCSIKDIDVLTLDHINGGGRQHRKVTNPHTYRWVLKGNFPEGFQVLCFNCNWKKWMNSQHNK